MNVPAGIPSTAFAGVSARESPFVVFDCDRRGGSIGGFCGAVGVTFRTAS